MVLLLHDKGLACDSDACNLCGKKTVEMNDMRAMQYESVAFGRQACIQPMRPRESVGESGSTAKLLPEPLAIPPGWSGMLTKLGLQTRN